MKFITFELVIISKNTPFVKYLIKVYVYKYSLSIQNKYINNNN